MLALNIVITHFTNDKRCGFEDRKMATGCVELHLYGKKNGVELMETDSKTHAY